MPEGRCLRSVRVLFKQLYQDGFTSTRNEFAPLLPIHCWKKADSEIHISSPLFGINSYGVHLTAYVKDGDQMKIWVPRRAAEKQTYGGMLDNTVAGGISVGETPMECLVREADEEASFPADLIRGHAKPVGTVSYFMIRDKRAGGEEGLMQPECQFVYDLEVDKSVIPKPNDDEVSKSAERFFAGILIYLGALPLV